MKLNDFFNEPDEVTTDRVSEKCPALSDQHKERLFAMSKRKYDINNNNDISKVSEVSGVEHYSKPKWYKAVSIAAAAVLAVGGLGSGMALIIRNGHAPASSSQVSEDNIETSTVEEKTESTTSEEITMTEDEYKAIGKEITDNYLEISNIIQGCKVSTDENDCISYYVYDSQDTEWTNNYAYYRTFSVLQMNASKISMIFIIALSSIKQPDAVLIGMAQMIFINLKKDILLSSIMVEI